MSNVKKESKKTDKKNKAKGKSPKTVAKKAKASGNNDAVGNYFDGVKLGADVVKFRFDSQISQSGFAQMIGISKTMIYDLEVGGNPTAKVLAKILPAINQPFEKYIIKHKIVAGLKK